MYYHPDSSLAALIAGLIKDYADERQRYWSEHDDRTPDDQGQRFLQFVDDLAAGLVQAATDLARPDVKRRDLPLDWKVARTFSRSELLRNEVRQRLELLLAEELADVASMAERCLRLVDWALTHQPSHTVLQFLRRVGRCYLVGLDPESLVMCRAALENGVNEAIEARQIVVPFKTGKSEMKAKLDALLDRRLLSRSRSADAWAVWKRGSKAAHEDPHATQRVFETITTTLIVLSDLHGAALDRDAGA